jgi:hypothetical protein
VPKSASLRKWINSLARRSATGVHADQQLATASRTSAERRAAITLIVLRLGDISITTLQSFVASAMRRDLNGGFAPILLQKSKIGQP